LNLLERLVQRRIEEARADDYFCTLDHLAPNVCLILCKQRKKSRIGTVM
jgi:hypothetical protein